MRTLLFALVALSLIAVAPTAEASPGSGGACHVQEEYVTEATLGDPDNLDPENLVQPGAPRPIECYY